MLLVELLVEFGLLSSVFSLDIFYIRKKEIILNVFIIYNVWLNRKINNIEKKTKPEIYKKLFSTTLSSEFLEKNSAKLQYTNDLLKR